MRRAAATGLVAVLLIWAAHAADTIWFEDRMAGSGISFVLRNSPTPEKHQIETMAGGVALLDYDNDGKLDIFFANGAQQPSLEKTDPSFYNRLYRNRGDWKFEDVTEKAGLRGEGFSMGAAAADFNNDGFTDLFVSGVRSNILYRNRGDGTFEDVTAKAGLSNQNRWAISAGWFDYDNDGLLDLFVVNYVKWDPAKEPRCGEPATYVSYCHPKYYEGLANTLYHNSGNGTFTDVSEKSGIGRLVGKGMSVAFADYDGDGYSDIFVANDAVPNFLFHNERDGTFREVGLRAGVAISDDGRALSSMGVDFRDIDNDGLPDLIVSALTNETFPFFRNAGKGFFDDVTYGSRIGSATLPFSGWSVGAYDFENSGRKSFFIACGDFQEQSAPGSSRKSLQTNLLLVGGPSYTSYTIGSASLHRGAAFGDLDGDGRTDVVVTRLGGAPLLLRNVVGGGNHWIDLKLSGARANRDAIGARAHLVTADTDQWNEVTTAVGYASSSETVVHFGLGKEAKAKLIEILWPGGRVQRLRDVPADRVLIIREQDQYGRATEGRGSDED